MGRCLVTVLLAASLLGLPAVGAFSAKPHGGITEEGANRAGFPDEAIPALQAAVLAPDVADHEWDPEADDPRRMDADGSFRPEHHCDRVPPGGHAAAFDAAVAYVREKLDGAAAALRADDAEKAMERLGEALHAAQDCSSHSNAVDLAVEADFPAMVLGDEPPPADLWLTGFEPGADDPESPEGDPYPHGRFAKDSADKNAESRLALPDGRTKYETARDLATATTELLLGRFLIEVGEEEAAALAGVEPVDGDGVLGVPAVGAVPVLALLAALTVLCGRRRR